MSKYNSEKIVTIGPTRNFGKKELRTNKFSIYNIENNFRLTIEKVLKNNVYTNNEFSSKAKATGLKYSWSELSKIYYKILVQ